MIPGDIAIITKEAKHHDLKIGQIVVIFRTCLDGYKVILPNQEVNDDNPVQWTYIEELHLEYHGGE